jgi:hypothetical protein
MDLIIQAGHPGMVNDLYFIRLRRKPRVCPWLNAQTVACYGAMSPPV